MASCLDIRRVVVDEHSLRRFQPVLPHEKFEDLWMRFDEADSTGDEDAREPLQKREAIANGLELVSSPVGERIERNLALTKLAQELNGLMNGKMVMILIRIALVNHMIT